MYNSNIYTYGCKDDIIIDFYFDTFNELKHNIKVIVTIFDKISKYAY